MVNEKWEIYSFFSNAEPLPLLQFQSIHLPFVSGVIITAKVQQPMKNKLRDFVIEGQSIFLRLARRLLN
jgi:hypothetical protein